MYSIPSVYKQELAEFRNYLSSDGSASSLNFKIFRIVHGVYEQRSTGTYMLRIRCAAGVISTKQFRAIASLIQNHINSYLHITSRQELQIHNILLQDVPDILDALYKVGLSTKGSGGNTVRNIIASEESGISSSDVFDVIPYNIALTNYLTVLDKSFELPRKLKISFSSSSDDSGLARFNDLGFIAKIQNGQKGFSVYLGGSAAVNSFIGICLFDFIPDYEIYRVSHAVVNFFYAEGNRKNRNKARLRYLFFELGTDEVIKRFHCYYKSISDITIPELPEMPVPAIIGSSDISRTIANEITPFITRQVQDGLVSLKVPVFQGNMNSKQADDIMKILDTYTLDYIYFTLDQNIRLRNIPIEMISAVYDALKESDFNFDGNLTSSTLVACTGADTCQLGLCLSKGSLNAINQEISSEKYAKNIRIKISGCPNSCGQHMVADLGFSGKISRNEKLYPAYKVYAGGLLNENNPRFAEYIGAIAAKDIHRFTRDVMTSYNNSEYENFYEYCQKNNLKKIIESYAEIPGFDENADYYFDWGDNNLFTSTKRKKAECSVGLLDLIEDNLSKISECNKALQAQQSSESHILLSQDIMHGICELFTHLKKQNFTKESDRRLFIEDEFLIEGSVFNQYNALFQLYFSDDFQKLKNHRLELDRLVKQTLSYYSSLNRNLEYALPHISAVELSRILNSDASFRLIDIREEWEKELADIGGERIPEMDIRESKDNAGLSQDEEIIFYCRRGIRTANLLEELINNRGFTNIKHLEGGIHSWSDTVDSSIKKY